MQTLIKPVILCGGTGTRLWPLSRAGLPKQFIELPTQNARTSLFQLAINRINRSKKQSFLAQKPTVIANIEHKFILRSQLQQINQSADVFLEPSPRNTAASLTIAAILAEREDPILIVLPSDHMIDEEKLNFALENAIPDCTNGAIILLGITPSYAETGYGYIRTETTKSDHPISVLGFTEKPNLETAQQFLQDGHYLWNSGIFILRASTWISAIKKCAPEIEKTCRQSIKESSRLKTGEITSPIESFQTIPKNSIDCAVIERCSSNNILLKVLPFNGFWTDLGSWDSVLKASTRDNLGNFVSQSAVCNNCKNSLLISTSKLVVGNGLENLAVLETPDAVLVTNLNNSQDIKNIVEHLQSIGQTQATQHRKVFRPWGYYDSIDEAPGFKVKRIVVYPNSSLSLQRHRHRTEHWTVVSGTASVRIGDRELLVCPDESVYIPKGEIHRLANYGASELIVIEVQTGSYLEEDDIERLDDVYGR